MKINIVTDAWEPQINGVVRTYQNTIKEITKLHLSVKVINPYSLNFKIKPLIGYKEIEVVLNPWLMKRALDNAIASKEKIHIATEGPLGLYARWYLEKRKYNYTTSFHTLFPEFIEKRFGISALLLYPYFKWFHKRSKAVFVPTLGMKTFLENKGIKNIKVWTRGVNQEIFNPNYREGKEKPYIICVSRVSKEKGLDDFCKLDYTRKIIVGDGPYLNELKRKYPEVEFIGKKEGRDLAYWFANAEAFVFPSKSDTFGIVLLEAIACGTPVLAYDQPGPREVLTPDNGIITDNLQADLNSCVRLDRNKVYETSKRWSWKNATAQFLEAINE